MSIKNKSLFNKTDGTNCPKDLYPYNFIVRLLVYSLPEEVTIWNNEFVVS